MRDFFIFFAVLLSVVSLLVGASGRESDAVDADIEALQDRQTQLESQTQALSDDLWCLRTDLDTYHKATDADLDSFSEWSECMSEWADLLLEALSPPVDEESEVYDCDDATLDAFRFYTERGYPCCIMAGDIHRTGEGRREVDHVWLLVRYDGGWLPIDWGAPAYDSQHFEGYWATLPELLHAVAVD